MAQQQGQGGQGGIQEAPRENRTIKDFHGQNTQNERNALDPGSFHWLENIQPIGKGNLHSIPGRSKNPITSIPPIVPPVTCTDTSARGQQSLSEQLAFDQVNSTVPPGINGRTSWAYISPTGDVTTLIGSAPCGGGNMTYFEYSPAPAANCCQLNHFINNVATVNDYPALIDPNNFFPAINCRLGTSDEPAYFFMF